MVTKTGVEVLVVVENVSFIVFVYFYCIVFVKHGFITRIYKDTGNFVDAQYA